MGDGLISLRLLGGLELTGSDGRPVTSLLSQPRRLALLVYLTTAAPGRLHRKDTVRTLFWPEADGLRARQALNRAIYVLRHTLDPEAVVTRGDDEVGVREGRIKCDVILFEQALEAGSLDPALELYRGDLAPGFLVSGIPDFERWLEGERSRLRARAVAAAMELAGREEALGRLTQAEGWAHRAALLSPYDERAVARRIALLDRLGDRAGAQRAFDELRRRLREDLEVEPSPETAALLESVRARGESRRVLPASGTAPNPTDVWPHRLSASGTSMRARLPPRLLTGALVLGLGLGLSALLHRPRAAGYLTANAVKVTSQPGIEIQPALSPDGSLVAFAVLAEHHTVMALRSTASAEGGEVRPAGAEQEDQTLPAWSADGELLRYRSTPNPGAYPASFVRAGNPAAFEWRAVHRLGGSVRTVTLPRESQWAAWSGDGARVAFTGHDSIFVVEAGANQARLLAVQAGAWSLNSLAWSPDGAWIAYVDGNPIWVGGWNTGASDLWLVGSGTGRRVHVSGAGHLNVSPAWLDAHHLLFVADLEGEREVYAAEIGPKGPRGPLAVVPGGTDAHTISISADGRRLAVARLVARQNVWSFPLDAGRPLSAHEGTRVTTGSQVVETHDVSADGKWLAYDTDVRGAAEIYKVSLDGGAPIPVVSGSGGASFPRWSPDGRELAYYGGRGTDIWVVSAEGGNPTRLTDAPGIDENPQWSPDGLSLSYRTLRSGRLAAWIVNRERVEGPWREARKLTDLGCSFQAWAHDNLGVICGAPHQTEFALVSRAGTVLWRRDLAASGLSELGPPTLSPDGTTLYLRAARGSDAGIWAWPLAGGRPHLVMAFDDPAFMVQSYPGTINATRDRLYLTVGEFESDIWVMDLKRR
jgi:Tol biopolymer transport system component/DNA-binding SARP family transcriptional activator